MVKAGTGAARPVFEAWLCCFPAVCPWVGYQTSLCFCFLICKMTPGESGMETRDPCLPLRGILLAYFCSRPVTLSLSALNWPLVPLGGPAPLGGPTLLVVQPGGHHLYFPASHKPSLLAKLDGTTHLCLSPPLPPMSLPVLVPAAPTARLPDPEPYSDPPLTTGALLPPFPVPQDSELPEGQVQPLLRLRCPLCGQHGQGPILSGHLSPVWVCRPGRTV